MKEYFPLISQYLNPGDDRFKPESLKRNINSVESRLNTLSQLEFIDEAENLAPLSYDKPSAIETQTVQRG